MKSRSRERKGSHVNGDTAYERSGAVDSPRIEEQKGNGVEQPLGVADTGTETGSLGKCRDEGGEVGAA